MATDISEYCYWPAKKAAILVGRSIIYSGCCDRANDDRFNDDDGGTIIMIT